MTDDHLQRTAILETQVRSIQDTLEEIKPMVRETHQRVTQIGAFSAALAALVSFVWGVGLAIMAFFKDRVN